MTSTLTPEAALAAFATADKRRTRKRTRMIKAERSLGIDAARIAFQRADRDRTEAAHRADDAYRMAQPATNQEEQPS